ncbi:MAG: hypothetical protein K0S58_1949 [Nitrospira sp.]|jgi:DNA-directed RNA polymerase specialized sigma subunit|nr:hypothetical protein [Nitrospira sp.]
MAKNAREAPKRQTSPRQAEQTDRNVTIIRSFLEGVSVKHIAKAAGVSTIRVNQIVRRQAARTLPHMAQHVRIASLAELREILRKENGHLV